MASNNAFQRVIVMRHGARLDTADPNWIHNTDEGRLTPYDTPLTEPGKVQAFDVANKRYIDKGITMIISSPFLRCLQTAQEACRSLQLPGITINNSVCEILSPGSKMQESPKVPRPDLTPYGINILQYDENPLPKYPETTQEAIARYFTAIPSIADRYYPNNILVVTHQYGVEVSAIHVLGKAQSYEASYCGHIVLVRDGITDKWRMESKYRLDAYENLID